jgi:hypothetical protein
MPELIPTKKFLKDMEAFRDNLAMRKKLAKALIFLGNDPLHPGLNTEKIINDTSAWSVRVGRRYRISIDPKEYLQAGNPDWNAPIILLRILDHDDLYKFPR